MAICVLVLSGLISRRLPTRTGTLASAAPGSANEFDASSVVCTTAIRVARHHWANVHMWRSTDGLRNELTGNTETDAHASAARSNQPPDGRKQARCTDHRSGSRRRTSTII